VEFTVAVIVCFYDAIRNATLASASYVMYILLCIFVVG